MAVERPLELPVGVVEVPRLPDLGDLAPSRLERVAPHGILHEQSSLRRAHFQMRIAQVAPPFETVPPRAYGGTERVVSTLTEALVRRGHEVTLFAMVEALASGTPVVALRAGSVPEVVEDGVTGYVCDSEDELAAAVERLGKIDRARCRAEAERRFSPDVMAERYEEIYRRLLAEPSAPAVDRPAEARGGASTAAAR